MSQPTGLTLIGLGAIGRAIVQRTRDWPEFSLRHRSDIHKSPNALAFRQGFRFGACKRINHAS